METIQKSAAIMAAVTFVAVVVFSSPNPPHENSYPVPVTQRERPAPDDIYRYMDAQDSSTKDRVLIAEQQIATNTRVIATMREDIGIIKDRQERGNAMMVWLLGLVSAGICAMLPNIMGPFFRKKR